VAAAGFRVAGSAVAEEEGSEVAGFEWRMSTYECRIMKSPTNHVDLTPNTHTLAE
jgi:hypothetical protein